MQPIAVIGMSCLFPGANNTDELWENLWGEFVGIQYRGEEKTSREKFNSLKFGISPPLDVYDAASMSVISPLSEKSIRLGSSAVKIPDFTRGKWKNNKSVFGL